jgi:ABC-type branched-subunit amino acid transport system substrate-binding protein
LPSFTSLAPLATATALVVLAAGVRAPAETPDIVLGMSAALSGPSAALGRGMRTGVEALLRRVNETGGVNGRRLRLVALDDSYQAAPVKDNMVRLIEQERALAVIGNVGTQGASVAVPIANQRKVLLFGALSGAELLRKSPPDRYVINLRASYAEETDVMVRGLLKHGIKPQQIAFFTQKDAYGDSGFAGAVRALKELGFDDAASLAHGRYERGTLDVEEGVLALIQARVRPRAVIMVGAYGACAKFIRLARQLLPGATFLNVSFVGSAALNRALGADGDGVIITQVVPHYDSRLPGVAEYRHALTRAAPGVAPDFVSLEGYFVAKAFVEGLRRAGPNPSRERIVDAIENGAPIDIGMGAPLRYSKAEHQGSHQVWLTVIRGRQIVPLEW